MQAETKILNACLMALSKAGCLVWRNNTGALQDKNGRWVSFGLCKGSADIIGIAPDGRFLAVEVKAPGGKVSLDQQKFVLAVQLAGGLAGVARSADEALSIIGLAKC